ncbi:MAG: HNH endonuclease [Bryobacteraceae bacterium]
MRPVRRGPSPRTLDFEDYTEAKADLVARLGPYCSFCERRIPTNLAVEHIQAKHLHPNLIGRWDNFLLACVNCNSTKGKKNVLLSELLLPDRDNTFTAFDYLEDGRVLPTESLTRDRKEMASASLALTGLEKTGSETQDQNEEVVALDRASQRMQSLAHRPSVKGQCDERSRKQGAKRSSSPDREPVGLF